MSSHTMVPVAGGIFPANILRSVDFSYTIIPDNGAFLSSRYGESDILKQEILIWMYIR